VWSWGRLFDYNFDTDRIIKQEFKKCLINTLKALPACGLIKTVNAGLSRITYIGIDEIHIEDEKALAVLLKGDMIGD
jgi:hypothetical protein